MCLKGETIALSQLVRRISHSVRIKSESHLWLSRELGQQQAEVEDKLVNKEVKAEIKKKRGFFVMFKHYFLILRVVGEQKIKKHYDSLLISSDSEWALFGL